MPIPFLKPSDLKPVPADRTLVRDANALKWLSKAEFLTGEATRSYLQNNTTAYRQLLLAAFTALQRGIAATNADSTELKRTTANTSAISAIFTNAVRAEEAESTDEAKVRTDALKTLHDLMNDEYVPHAIRVDIAKYVIESRIG